jgi:hypothetical protein
MSSSSSKRKADEPAAAKYFSNTHGDLRLEIGDGPSRESVVVNSVVLQMHSPVFRVMLSGPFLEGIRPDHGDWVVRLPADDVAGMTILFDIIHANFDRVPIDVAGPQLRSVAIAADKYDMLAVLKPWIVRWSHFVEPNPDAYLQTCWLLGLEDRFRVRIAKLVRNLE